MNTYRYQDQHNLGPIELFFLIAVDETSKQAGIDDLEAIILILSGLPILPTRAARRDSRYIRCISHVPVDISV
jgi:hypothetical protein